MLNYSRRFVFGAGVLASLVVGVAMGWGPVATATAQTGPSILIRPWQEEVKYAETTDRITYVPNGHVKETDGDFDVFSTESQGRIRFDPENPDPRFVLGYQADIHDFGTDDARIPEVINVVAISGGVQLGEIAEDWRVSAILGAGTANDGHWNDDNSFFGRAAVNVQYIVDETSQWNFGMDYNGNRTVFPDLPLPYVYYYSRPDPKFGYTVGFPFMSIDWLPQDQVRLEATWALPISLTGRLSYYFTEDLRVYGEYSRSTQRFHRKRDSDTRYTFYEGQQAIGAVEWANPYGVLTVGGGYAFEREFGRGWDSRDIDVFAEVSDEPFMFIQFAGRF